MYIRATRTHTNKDGSGYSYRLVTSERTGDKVRQKTLLNLGTDYKVPREDWKQVADTAEAMLHGQMTLLEIPADIQAAAEDIVTQLRARGLSAGTADDGGIATVDLDTIEHENPRSVGCERLCLKALDELRFPAILEQLGVTARDTRIAQALLAGRMVHPASERETSRWLRHDSAAAELLGLEDDPKALARRALYRVGDILWRHREEIQKQLFQREREIFDLPETIVFYDLTNVHYHGRHRGQLLAFGRSKQKRDDCPLVTLALALDESGFPRNGEILPGNASEPETLAEAIERLEAGSSGSGPKPTVVIDAGIASKENIEWLGKQGYDWIAVSRGARPPAPEEMPGAVLMTEAKHRVEAWRLAEENDEVRLYVVSEGKKATEEQILGLKRTRFEEAIDKLHQGLSKKGCTKRYDKVLESVGRIRQRFSKVSRHYEVTVDKADKGANAAAVRCRRRKAYDDADNGAGAYVLRTSHTDWDIEKILRTYWRITDIEATFRSLKSELGLRPVYHQKDHRIAAHLMISVLAWHAVQLIRIRLAKRGIRKSWTHIRRSMQTWVRVTTRIREVGGTLIVNRQDTRPAGHVAEMAVAAGEKPALHRQRMRISV